MTRNDSKLVLLLLFLQRPSVFTDPQSNNRLPPSRLLASITRHPGQWCNLIWKIQLLVLSMKSMGQGLIIVVRSIEIPPPPFKTARLQDCIQYLHVVCSDPKSLDFVPWLLAYTRQGRCVEALAVSSRISFSQLTASRTALYVLDLKPVLSPVT